MKIKKLKKTTTFVRSWLCELWKQKKENEIRFSQSNKCKCQKLILERFTHTVGNKKSSKKTSKMEEKEFLRLFIRFITWHTGSSYFTSSQKWWICSFSLQCQYIIQQSSNESKQAHHLEGVFSIISKFQSWTFQRIIFLK